MKKKQHEPCRGFECRHYHFDKYPKAPGGHTYCDKNPFRRKAILSSVSCDGCKTLNDCNACIHSKNCQYSSAK